MFIDMIGIQVCVSKFSTISIDVYDIFHGQKETTEFKEVNGPNIKCEKDVKIVMMMMN